MDTVEARGRADLALELAWQSEEASHRDIHFAQADLWGDILPPRLTAGLPGLARGESFSLELTSAEAMPAFSKDLIKELRPEQFSGGCIAPRQGRFYPRRLLSGVPGVPPGSDEPCRCIAADHHGFTTDLNHPLAGRQLTLTATVADPAPSTPAVGQGVDWMSIICTGPGMQARGPRGASDFLGGPALIRDDEADDAVFYAKPRLVGHLDSLASTQIAELYGQLVPPGARVLDLMSAYQSHLPDSLETGEVVGLGMNLEEMQANPRVDQAVVHDLNAQPALPFDEAAFDAVICTASVEYLTQPREVFADTARVLKPDGVFVLTFSNRFFPPKCIYLWKELHDFEKMGLVLDYFQESQSFGDLGTLSQRGWPRPEDDRHFGEYPTADPVYGVWGRKLA